MRPCLLLRPDSETGFVRLGLLPCLGALWNPRSVRRNDLPESEPAGLMLMTRITVRPLLEQATTRALPMTWPTPTCLPLSQSSSRAPDGAKDTSRYPSRGHRACPRSSCRSPYRNRRDQAWTLPAAGVFMPLFRIISKGDKDPSTAAAFVASSVRYGPSTYGPRRQQNHHDDTNISALADQSSDERFHVATPF